VEPARAFARLVPGDEEHGAPCRIECEGHTLDAAREQLEFRVEPLMKDDRPDHAAI
jgi:hypothetical protein